LPHSADNNSDILIDIIIMPNASPTESASWYGMDWHDTESAAKTSNSDKATARSVGTPSTRV